MKCRIVFTVSDEQRKALSHFLRHRGVARRTECVQFISELVATRFAGLVHEHRDFQARGDKDQLMFGETPKKETA